MKHFKLKNLLLAIISMAALSSCNKDKNDVAPDKPAVAQRAGFYILNQGGFTHPNGSLTYYDYTTKKTTADIFSTVNGMDLGDTPNDVEVYGSKMYIVVNYSSVVYVVNPKTAKIIQKISFLNNGVARQPRDVAFYKNNAFVTSYDGTVAVIDTGALTVSKFIPVGLNPEQLVVSNSKLYVANSGGLTPGVDKTVSVIDLTSLTESKKITVGTGPVSMGADANGHVYVLSTGDYFNNVPSSMTIIDNKTDAVISQNSTAGSFNTQIITNGDFVYFLTADGKVQVYNGKTLSVSSANFITDGTAITTPYGIGFDSTTGELFVTDAIDYSSNGSVYAFDKTGKKEYVLTAGINPANIAFVNK